MRFKMFLLMAALVSGLGAIGIAGTVSAADCFGIVPDYRWDCTTNKSDEVTSASHQHSVPTPDYPWTKEDMNKSGATTQKAGGSKEGQTPKAVPPKS